MRYVVTLAFEAEQMALHNSALVVAAGNWCLTLWDCEHQKVWINKCTYVSLNIYTLFIYKYDFGSESFWALFPLVEGNEGH